MSEGTFCHVEVHISMMSASPIHAPENENIHVWSEPLSNRNIIKLTCP